MNDSVQKERPWLLHYPWQVAPACDYPSGNAARLLIGWAERSPGAKPGGYLCPAWNCVRLLRASRKFANALVGLGIGRGERVALVLPDCAQSFIAFFGTLMAGAIAVPLEAGTGPDAERETRRRLIETEAAAAVVYDSHLPAIAAAREGTFLRAIIATSKADGSPGTPAKLPAARLSELDPFARRRVSASGVERWSHLLRRFPDSPVFVQVDADRELAMIRYTRGTTGDAKGAMLTHANLIAGAVQVAAWRYAEEQAQLRYLAALPIARRSGDGVDGYCIAEAAAHPAAQPANRLGRMGMLGIPLPDTEARIVGEAGFAPLSPGEIGELIVRGPQIAAGYWRLPQASSAVFQDGWLRTGDMAVMDEDGFIALVDRKAEVFPRGGQTVYPRRVELELIRHPAVAAAVVVGIPKKQGETAIRAFVTLRRGCRTSVMQLRRWGLERLSEHEAPDEYEVCDRLPSKLKLREGQQ
nr:AMP-binding protein [Cohnella lubricantis]